MGTDTLVLAIALAIPTLILGLRVVQARRSHRPWKILVTYWCLAIAAITLTTSILGMLTKS